MREECIEEFLEDAAPPPAACGAPHLHSLCLDEASHAVIQPIHPLLNYFSTTMSNPLDTQALLGSILDLLPRGTSSPLPHAADSVAALVHAIHVALQFRLVQPNAGSSSASTSAQPTTESQEGEEGDADDGASETATAVDQDEGNDGAPEGRLVEGWNSRGEDSYSFEYRHGQSAMTFRIRVGRMGGRVQIDGMAEDGAPNSLSMVLTDLVNPSAFPIPSSATSSSTQSSSSGEGPAKSLGFQSISAEVPARNHLQAVTRSPTPRLHRQVSPEHPNYHADSSSGDSDHRARPPTQPSTQPAPRHDPLIDPSFPGSGGDRGPFNPLSGGTGNRDLDPLASMRPPGQFNPNRDGDGMYMDFNNPIFDARRRQNPDFQGPGGSIQPPGARWDPIGPGMGGRFPSGPGGNPLGGVGMGDPDFDELLPPGEFGPDLGRGGIGGPLGRGGGRGGRGGGGFPGLGPGGFGGGRLGGGGGGLGGGGGFGGPGGGGMYM